MKTQTCKFSVFQSCAGVRAPCKTRELENSCLLGVTSKVPSPGRRLGLRLISFTYTEHQTRWLAWR